jgi:hypothetical protein
MEGVPTRRARRSTPLRKRLTKGARRHLRQSLKTRGVSSQNRCSEILEFRTDSNVCKGSNWVELTRSANRRRMAANCAFETSSRCRETKLERTSIATVRIVLGLAYPVGSGPPIASRRFEAQHTLLYEVPNIECRSENQQLREGIRCCDESAMRIPGACKAYAPPGCTSWKNARKARCVIPRTEWRGFARLSAIGSLFRLPSRRRISKPRSFGAAGDDHD